MSRAPLWESTESKSRGLSRMVSRAWESVKRLTRLTLSRSEWERVCTTKLKSAAVSRSRQLAVIIGTGNRASGVPDVGQWIFHRLFRRRGNGKRGSGTCHLTRYRRHMNTHSKANSPRGVGRKWSAAPLISTSPLAKSPRSLVSRNAPPTSGLPVSATKVPRVSMTAVRVPNVPPKLPILCGSPVCSPSVAANSPPSSSPTSPSSPSRC